MKKTIKKLLGVAVIALMAFTAFGQESQTSDATNKLFTTDVDKFMDVNQWADVNPENAFIMFDKKLFGTYDIGFAKQFSSLYWGTYFSGSFGSYEKVVSKVGDTTTTTEHNGQQNSVNDSASYTFYNLFGFGDIGVKVGFNYYNPQSEKTDTTRTNKAAWGIYTRVGWGNMSIGSLDITPYAWINYDANDNFGTEESTNSNVTSDTRRWNLNLGLGGSTVLINDDLKEGTLATSLGFSFIKPVNKDKNTSDKSEVTKITLPVTYECVFTPAEKFSFAFGTKLSNTLSITKAGDVKTTAYTFTPTFYTGFQFDTLKKFVLNAGAEFDLPYFTNSEVKNSNAKTTTTTTRWHGDNASVTLSSGFEFKPVKNLSFDCRWNILADLFDNTLSTQLTEGDNNFWNTVNNLLVHNITVQISYKF